ncbi:uncharacterized protein VTP21DRAFT_2660 [Calcarisporiella thermophila]|uniref:uncharacterized protein n=1 Tax=Calcarisporiella thermophila TaxID=911321 RepID=UPI003741EF93
MISSVWNKLSSKPPEYQSQSTLQEQKRKQIASLYSYNSGVKELTAQTQYEIPCPLPKLNIYLILNLPAQFPEQPPIITVSPSVTHPWVDHTGAVIGHEKLRNWSGHGVLIGRVVKEIIQEFGARPPVKGYSAAVKEAQAQFQEGSEGRNGQPISEENNSAQAADIGGTINNASHNFYLSLIQSKSPEELRVLLENEAAFDEFFQELEPVKNALVFQQEMTNGNESLAKKNLSRKPELEELQRKLDEKHQTYMDLRNQFNEHIRMQADALQRFSSDTLITRLKAAALESDELSESVAKSFLDGNLEHDVFIREFRELRKVYHLRALRAERVQRDPGILHSMG